MPPRPKKITRPASPTKLGRATSDVSRAGGEDQPVPKKSDITHGGGDSHPTATPYLVVPASPGDTGSRPLSGVTFLHCASIDIVDDQGSSVVMPTPGKSYKLRCLITNLGAAASYGGIVEFYVGQPPVFDTAAAAGNAFIAAKGYGGFMLMPGASMVAECHNSWTPATAGEAASTILVQAYDPFIDPVLRAYDARLDRHVGRREVTVVRFDKLPDGTPVTTDRVLVGNEFAARGINLAAVPTALSGPGATSAAILQHGQYAAYPINFPFLTSSTPANVHAGNLALVRIAFTSPARAASLVFVGAARAYTLDVHDTSGGVKTVQQVADPRGGEKRISFQSAQADIAYVTFGCKTESCLTCVKEVRFV